MTDYWLNKLIFDLQSAGGKATWMNEREAFMDRYPLSAELKRALREDDFATLHPLANAYLFRNFLLMCGLNDDQSVEVLHALHDKSPIPGRQAGFVKGARMPEDRSGEAAHG